MKELEKLRDELDNLTLKLNPYNIAILDDDNILDRYTNAVASLAVAHEKVGDMVDVINKLLRLPKQ